MSVNSMIGRFGATLPSPFRTSLRELALLVHWWSNTLLSLIPSFVWNSLLARNTNFALQFTNNGYYFDGQLLSAESVQQSGLRGRRFDLVLPGDQVAVLRRSIPAAAASRAAEIMALKADAETPFKAEHIFRDVKVLDQKDGEDCTAILALVTKTRVSAHKQALSEIGLEVAAIDYLESDGTRAGMDLHSNRQADHKKPRLSVAKLLGMGILVLLLAWFGGRIIQQNSAIAETAALKERLSPQAEVARQTQTTLYELLNNLEDFETRVASPTKFQPVYQELTSVVPDHTWLQSLTYTDRKIVISGLSKQPEDLLSSVNSSAIVSNAKFTSSIVRDARHEADRFRLEIDLSEASNLSRDMP